MLQQHNRIALSLLQWVENLGLLLILAATLAAGFSEVRTMFEVGRVSLSDLLLLFLYLEIITMLGLYYKEGKLPVRYPIYIAIVALTRYIVLGMKEMDKLTLIAITGAILMLTLSALLLRYGQTRMPYKDNE
ncbi:MAG TPA: phosphate-starvation-inducible PsiE family protein [Thiobacillaceae bacterium]|nr:phosphate-starvation-inducible PsiE family protein [Thiobacillaceae bacterium]